MFVVVVVVCLFSRGEGSMMGQQKMAGESKQPQHGTFLSLLFARNLFSSFLG